jgi:hypothetical protein
MSATMLETYQTTFGIPPEALLDAYENIGPEDWSPIKHYETYASPDTKQHIFFFASYNHSCLPNSPVVEQAREASDYVVRQVGVKRLGSLAVNVEGRVRKPPKLSLERFPMEIYGELGAFEAGLRERGITDENIKAPEPKKEVVQKMAQDVGPLPMLAYLIFRQLPQIMENSAADKYPFTQLHILSYKYIHQYDLPLMRDPSRRIATMWNERHPPELRMVPGVPVTPELIAALRDETTLLPCLKIPEHERSAVHHAAVSFNMERQVGYVHALAADLARRQHVVFAMGRMHVLALCQWLQTKTNSRLLVG